MTSSTVEKLVVQIFDRRKWIIEQAKHQAELYNQHLASKLAIDGIAPPPWLWTPNSQPKEMNKDELVLKLLEQHPKLSVCCPRPHYPLYTCQVGVGSDNAGFSDGVFNETLASDKGLDKQNCPMVVLLAISGEDVAGCTSKNVPKVNFSTTLPVDQTNERILINCPSMPFISGEDEAGCSLKNVSELDFRTKLPVDWTDGRILRNCPSVQVISGEDEAGFLLKNVSGLDFRTTFHVDQTDERILNIHEAPQSLVKIQRSKSRQKALELRSASKSLTKIGLSHGNLNDNFNFSSLLAEQEGRRDELPQSKDRCSINDDGKNQDFGESACQSKENVMDVSTGRVTRSRCCAKAPEFIGGFEGPGYGPGNCGQDVFSSGAKVGTRQSVSDYNFNQANYVNNLQQSAASFQARVLGSLDVQDCQGRDFENNVCASASDYSNSSHSSDNAQINHDAIREVTDHLPANRAHGSLVTGRGANVLDEQGDVSQSMTADCQNEEEIIVVPWSSQHTAPMDEDPHALSYFDGANHGPLLSISDRTALVPNSPHKEPGLVESSFSVVQRVTRSKSCATQVISNSNCPITSLLGSISKFDQKTKSAASVEHLTTPCSHMLPPFHETNDIINEQQGADTTVDTELVSNNLVDQFVGSSPFDTDQRGKLESQVEGSSQKSSLFVEPKALDVSDFTTTPGSEMKQLSSISEKMDCSFLDPAKSIDKHASGNMNQLSVDEEITELFSVCNKEGEEWANTIDSNAISQANVIADLNCERAKVNDTPYIHTHPVKLRVDQCHDLSPVQHGEEGNWRAKSVDKVSLVSNVLVSNACRQSNSLDLTNSESNVGLTKEGEMSGLIIPNSDGSPVMDSWPRLKRRKTKHHESYRHTSSPSVGTKKLDNIQIDPSRTFMTSTENDVKSIGMVIKELVGFDYTEPEYTLEYQSGKDWFCNKEQNKPKSSFTTSELSATTLVAGLTKKKAGNVGDLYVEGMQIHSCFHDDKLCSQYSSLRKENIAENTYHGKNSGKDQHTVYSAHYEGSELQQSVLSPRNNSECNVVGQSLHMFEEFMLDAQSYNGELDFPADEIDFEELKSPMNMLERASILAKICKSASTDTPLSDLSSALERASLLTSLDMDNLPLNGDDIQKQHDFGRFVNNVKDSFDRMPYSECQPNYGARYGWNPSASPVGKFWESLSLQSGSSSEKGTRTNPDLTCFRIEEDSYGSEENDTMDDIADSVQNDINSSPANPCDGRQPFMEITNLVNPPVSIEPVSVSLTTKPIIGAPQFKVKRSLRKQTSSVGSTEKKGKHTSSIGAYGIKKATESMTRSANRSILRSKARIKGEEQKLPLKDSRKNNIVSNVNSFLPLVQRTQAAPICAGKREVKVKALEAAEAAKRLEERRQNERRIKKEALRSERAKLEEKNMREMELKKKKEAQRKKKEDDVITNKRLREEEERKEEKKRMRLEASQRQREQEEKLRMRAKKAEKQKDHPKGGRKNNKPQVAESKNPHTNGSMRGHDSVLKDTETRRASTELAMHTVDKSPTRGILMAQTNQGKSYEISPYQCSDDEDEEEEELPVKKSIPSWASKSSVALLLPLQQDIEADAIFPPDSFCSMDDGKALFSTSSQSNVETAAA